MDKKAISNWIRQSRYRAKKQGLQCDLSIETVMAILDHYDHKCAYCRAGMETLDHPFPLKDESPNISANVLPICKKCKSHKKTASIVCMYNSGYLEKAAYILLIKEIISRDDTGIMKKHVKRLSGL